MIRIPFPIFMNIFRYSLDIILLEKTIDAHLNILYDFTINQLWINMKEILKITCDIFLKRLFLP